MSINDTARLQALKNQIDLGIKQKSAAEATSKELDKQKDNIHQQIRALDVEPEELDAAIAKYTAERDNGMSEAERYLNMPTTQSVAAPVQG
jgi:chromosome segregation ATPase